jgi:hypothetical protein
MSTLMTERRRPLENDAGQESLFGGDAFAAKSPTPTPWERQHAAPADPRARFEASVTPPLDAAAFAQAPLDEAQALGEHEHAPSTEDLAAYGLEVGAVPTEVPAHDAGEELAALERATTVPDGTRRPRTPLTGPTLDDVMSRAWEGLVTGLPAACPVCEGEVVASYAGSVHGSCRSCGTTIE